MEWQKAAYKFGECKRTIYRWRNRYDGTLESLKDKSRRHIHIKSTYRGRNKINKKL